MDGILKGIAQVLGAVPDAFKFPALGVLVLLTGVYLVLTNGQFLGPTFARVYIAVLSCIVVIVVLGGTAYAFAITAPIKAGLTKTTLASKDGPPAEVAGRHAIESSIVPRTTVSDVSWDLARLAGSWDAPPDVAPALQKLQSGDPGPMIEVLGRMEPTAELLSDRGLLAFNRDTVISLESYQKSVRLDGDNWFAWYQIALLQNRLRNQPAANSAIAQLRKVAGNDPRALGFASAAQGAIAYNSHLYKDAIRHFDEARGYFLTVDANDEYAQATAFVARAYYAQGDFDDAAARYQESLKTFTALSDAPQIAALEEGLAEIHSVRFKRERDPKDFDAAMALFQQSLSVSERIGDRQLSSSALRERGNLYVSRGNAGDLSNAEQDFKAALADLQALEDPIKKAYLYDSLGLLARSRGDFALAVKQYKAGLDEVPQQIDAGTQATLFRGLGIAYVRQGNARAGLDALNNALKRNQAIPDSQVDVGRDYFWIAEAQSNSGAKDAACDSARKAVDAYSSAGAKRDQAAAEAFLHSIC